MNCTTRLTFALAASLLAMGSANAADIEARSVMLAGAKPPGAQAPSTVVPARREATNPESLQRKP
jgi:hypothetical protein